MSPERPLFKAPPPERQIFCNRTLNLRAIKAIGYDMDYTLVHYRVRDWEERAYSFIRDKLAERGWPVAHLAFDQELADRGTIIDGEHGNLVQANRFGYVKRALHGTRPVPFPELRQQYEGVRADISDPRWAFLSTLFSLSEGCLFLQLVDLLDAGEIKEPGLGYAELWHRVRVATDTAHMEGLLKAEIIADPERFVEEDPEVPLALLDQKDAGKKLLLITNSEWHYTHAILTHAIDPHLPEGMTWRDLFDLVIVSARKPDFFVSKAPLFEVVNEEGLLRPHPGAPRPGGVYLGGHADLVEKGLGLAGDELLYVGDHVYSDVSASKRAFSWRTAFVMRELEDEVRAAESFRDRQEELDHLMLEKERLETEFSQARLALLRAERPGSPPPIVEPAEARRKMSALREKLLRHDQRIGVIVREANVLRNPNWGLLLRAGNDKSLLARQMENWADIYTSRVANFLYETPFVYLRSPRGSLPHDRAHRRDALPRLDEEV